MFQQGVAIWVCLPFDSVFIHHKVNYGAFTDYPEISFETLSTIYQKDEEQIPTTQTAMHLDVWSCQPKQSNSTRFKLVLSELIWSRPISLVNKSVKRGVCY